MAAMVGKPAPEFTGQAYHNGEFKEVSLSDFKGKKVVLFFYPLDFTFVCPTEILAFSDALDEFDSRNTAVVAASIDSHFSHYGWARSTPISAITAGLKCRGKKVELPVCAIPSCRTSARTSHGTTVS